MVNWSTEEDALMREMFKIGKCDADIADALAKIGSGRTARAVRNYRQKNDLFHACTSRDAAASSRASTFGLTHEQRVRCDEAYVDAMIAVGYLPYDPITEDGGLVCPTFGPAPLIGGNSCLS